MKKSMMNLMLFVLVLGIFAPMIFAQEDAAVQNYSIWVGGHYTDFGDYNKKVGEYRLGEDEFLPELEGFYQYRKADKFFRFDVHYFDNKNIDARALGIWGDRFSGELYFRSLIHQQGRDMLANMETREVGGGKILTHELLDEGADYHTDRYEFGGDYKVQLSRKNNIRMVAAHRTVIRKGYEQKIASSHCFSCHVTSHDVNIDKRTNQVEAGIQADAGEFTLGYLFGYRHFDSKAHDPVAYYDTAMHPVSELQSYKDEFPTRLNFDNVYAPYGTYPETEKISHKVRVKGAVGKGQLSGSVGYSQARNKKVDLSANTLSGALNYALVLNKKMRLIARASGSKLSNDDPRIDLADYREGRGGVQTEFYISDFDFTRYSALDRTDGRISAELISRLKPNLTLSLLAGFRMIDRADFKNLENETYTTKRFTGQAKLRYRDGLTFSSSVNYRFERTFDPFTSSKGLFESQGYDVLQPALYSVSGIDTTFTIFYYQREDLRYQNITTEPTFKHSFDMTSTYRPDMHYSFTVGLKGMYDKNNELDSLDVEHFSIQPSVNFTVTPDSKWSVMAGFNYNFNRSRGPVTVALFDG